ncbi:MAG: hypothetical protein KDA27_21745 [Candidatus Eisenbacteria bacterium]|uniref:PEGA domain-containing protein n=1 Tax=Eiseniibacteriota bacterium TaxID=2212470 RepID=A0A956SF94_UNCEI|nr:hypothetical protein [Candidatus Eisenbacteria bacterium]
MNEGSDRAVPPVRIELATSEIEGGPCRAWADPVQVMAAVAVSHPPETFAKSLLPSLEELSEFSEFGYSPNGLPMLVQAVLERLQNAHVRLWRENASGLHGLQSAAITCAVAEEDRVYFVKTTSAWVCLLRGGKAHPVERLDEQADESSGLGATEKLGLAVTSLPVQPGDIVVLLASEMNWAPDLRAVVNVFSQTTDLKRACDGLVNLLGLQSEGAGAVAFRFIPVGSERRVGENPLADLAGPMSLAALGAAGAAIDAANQRQADERARQEAEYSEQIRLEAEAAERARMDAERAEQARAEQARLEAEAAERARIEAERAEQARLEAEAAKHARMEAERAQQARLRDEAEAAERARVEAERAEQARAEQARLEAEAAEQARLEAEAAEHARMDAARAEQARLEAEAAERSRLEAEHANFGATDDPFADMTASMPEASGRPTEGVRSEAESFLESLGGGPAAEETVPARAPVERTSSADTTSWRSSTPPEPRAVSTPEPASSASTSGMTPDQFFAGSLPTASNGKSRTTTADESRRDAPGQSVEADATEHIAHDATEHIAHDATEHIAHDATEHIAHDASEPASHVDPVDQVEGTDASNAGVPVVAAAAGQSTDGGEPAAEPAYAFAGSNETGAEASSSEIEKSPDGVVAVAYRRPPSRDEYRGKTVFWPVLLAVLLGIALGIAAIPGGIHLPGTDALKSIVGGDSGTGPTGELHIESDPPPRRILVSGQDPIEGSIAHIERLPIGSYEVQLDLGPCGLWKTKVDVREGQTTEIRPTLRGQVKVAASDPTRNGFVWVEGGEKQPVPTTLEGLEVGWQRVFYEDDGLPIWERQVLVRTDKVASVLVPNDLRKGEGMVRVESLVLRDGLGMVESRGDSVWVDDAFAGATPLESRLSPGLHSVRVRTGDEYHTEMLELHGGGAQHVMAQFGLGAKPRLRHTSPGTVALSGSLVLTTEVESTDGTGVRQPLLHFPHLDSSLKEIPLSQVEPGRGVWVAIVDPLRMPRGEQVQYYFSASTASGDQVYSDLYTLSIGGRGSVSANRTRTNAARDEAPALASQANVPVTTPQATLKKSTASTGTATAAQAARTTAPARPVQPTADGVAAGNAPTSTATKGAVAGTAAAASAGSSATVAPGAGASAAREASPQPTPGTNSQPTPEVARQNTPQVAPQTTPSEPAEQTTAEDAELGDGAETTEPDPSALLGTLPEVRREVGLRESK